MPPTPGPSGDGSRPSGLIVGARVLWSPSPAGTPEEQHHHGGRAKPYGHRDTERRREPIGDRRERLLGGNPRNDYKLRVIDLRIGDPSTSRMRSADEIEDVKSGPCTTEHEFEVFYVGAMGEGSTRPTTSSSVRDPELQPRVRCLYRQGVRRFRLLIYWLVPTDDAWRSDDRTVPCAAYIR